MRIGIIGAGAMGGTLARRLAKRGHQVSIANSRGPESLAALAAEIGATPVSVVDATNTGEIVIISIPTKAVADLPRDLFANVPSSVVVIDTATTTRSCAMAASMRSTEVIVTNKILTTESKKWLQL